MTLLRHHGRRIEHRAHTSAVFAERYQNRCDDLLVGERNNAGNGRGLGNESNPDIIAVVFDRQPGCEHLPYHRRALDLRAAAFGFPLHCPRPRPLRTLSCAAYTGNCGAIYCQNQDKSSLSLDDQVNPMRADQAFPASGRRGLSLPGAARPLLHSNSKTRRHTMRIVKRYSCLNYPIRITSRQTATAHNRAAQKVLRILSRCGENSSTSSPRCFTRTNRRMAFTCSRVSQSAPAIIGSPASAGRPSVPSLNCWPRSRAGSVNFSPSPGCWSVQVPGSTPCMTMVGWARRASAMRPAPWRGRSISRGGVMRSACRAPAPARTSHVGANNGSGPRETNFRRAA